MHPELFTIQLGNFVWTAKAYSFFYSLAIIVAIAGTFWLAKRNGFEKKSLIAVLFFVSIGGLLGARIMHILTNWQAYGRGDYWFFSSDMEGFAISGGLLGAVLAGYLICRKMKLDFWRLGDLSVISLGVGIVLARLGCFLNGCCFGEMTKAFWGARFPLMSQAHQYQLRNGLGSFFQAFPVHPTQLYEAGAALIGSILALIIIRKKYPPGVAIAVFGLWFAFFRLINSYFRVMPSTLTAPKYFYPAFYVIIMLVCGSILYKKIKEKNHGN